MDRVLRGTQARTRRLPCSITAKTYTFVRLSRSAVKKSIARIPCAWDRRNSAQPPSYPLLFSSGLAALWGSTWTEPALDRRFPSTESALEDRRVQTSLTAPISAIPACPTAG